VKGAILESLEYVLVIWVGQVNATVGTAADEGIKERVKVRGQQISVTNYVHKNWYAFCAENEIR
jgi:hypothetical protein